VEGVIAVANSAAMPTVRPGFVSAPGNQVLSARPQREYDFFTGSSFSSAHVAGLVALIRQRKSDLSASAVKDLIAATAQTDQHIANACRALVRVVGEGDCSAPIAAAAPASVR
jgi:subtilisin family serine protease